MNDEQKSAIQTNWVSLLDKVDVGNSMLLDYLFEDKVIDKHQMELVNVQPVNKDKVAKLLEILLKKSPEAFNSFLEALDRTNQSHMANILRAALQPQQQKDGINWRLK